MRIPIQSFLIFSILSVPAVAQSDEAMIQEQVDKTQTAHNLHSWWKKDLVQADVIIEFNESVIVDGTFTFEAHGPKARYDRADGTSIIFDGESAWLTPANAEAPMGRFHVLTWPWFIMAPFKMAGEGIQLSDYSQVQINGKDYVTLYQTFGDDVGDTPDDWYRFFIDPKTNRIEAMSYIVTYGKEEEEANAQPSMIQYSDYDDTDGPLISRSYKFWYWDPENLSLVGNEPKGTGKVTAISYPTREGTPFAIPTDSRELELPSTNQ